MVGGPFGGKSMRNFGWGKNLNYAAKSALRARYGQGHFGTVGTHVARWENAVEFLRELGINDARQVTQGVLEQYAVHVGEGVEEDVYEASYAQNFISTANVVLNALRGDQHLWVEPSYYSGTRVRVRETPPTSMNADMVYACARDLRERGLLRAACAVALARTLGTRLRESMLADFSRWLRELANENKVNVIEGAKGGRTAPRWVRPGEAGILAISEALAARPGGSRNLLHESEQLIGLYSGELRRARTVLKEYGIDCYHDLRAAYACDRYLQITGHEAPVINGTIVDKELDLAARKVIALELGHNRIDVVGSYCGGRRS